MLKDVFFLYLIAHPPAVSFNNNFTIIIYNYLNKKSGKFYVILIHSKPLSEIVLSFHFLST